jgi:hypothetical protein
MQESAESEPQSIDEDYPTQPGKRHFHRKVRSGCLTCKKRRVKWVKSRCVSSIVADLCLDAMKEGQHVSDVKPRARSVLDIPADPIRMPPQRSRPHQRLHNVPAERAHHDTVQAPLKAERSSYPYDPNVNGLLTVP